MDRGYDSEDRYQLECECGQCGNIIVAEDERELILRFRQHLWQSHRRYMSEDSVAVVVRQKMRVSVTESLEISEIR